VPVKAKHSTQATLIAFETTRKKSSTEGLSSVNYIGNAIATG